MKDKTKSPNRNACPICGQAFYVHEERALCHLGCAAKELAANERIFNSLFPERKIKSEQQTSEANEEPL